MKGRFNWWPEWIEKKKKYARTAEKWMDEDRFNSICIGNGLPDISQHSTFSFRNVDEGMRRFSGETMEGEKAFARVYTRLGNPNTEYLEKILLKLECSHILDAAQKAGETEPVMGSLVFSSGMGAISTVLLSFLRPGDGIVIGNVYGCTDSLLRTLSERFFIDVYYADAADPEAVRKLFRKHDNITAVLIESPANPTLELYDIERISRITETHEALLIVDNTFSSPYLQQPFRLGADIVIHSLTKFVNGHSSSVAGAAIGPFNFMSTDVFLMYKDLGPTPSPFDSWLNSLTVQDLGVRVKHQSAIAARLAEYLVAHPGVEKVHYPGLEAHPQYDLCQAQMRNGGSMISFELKGGFEAGVRLMDYFGRPDTPMELAVSLGAVISYIEHPASMTHGVVPEADRLKRGITDSLVRISVGGEGFTTIKSALDDGLRFALDAKVKPGVETAMG